MAVVLEVTTREEDGKHVVRVGEQNQENNVMWIGGTYADELVMEVSQDGCYSITHPDADLELVGWVRAQAHEACPRPQWTLLPPQLEVSGVYDVETTKALQRFFGSFADGDHGGMSVSEQACKSI